MSSELSDLILIAYYVLALISYANFSSNKNYQSYTNQVYNDNTSLAVA